MGIADGIRAGAWLMDRASAAGERREEREMRKHTQSRENYRADLQLRYDQVRLEAYERQMAREESDYERQSALHRLGMEAAFLNGAIDDLQDDEVLSPLYLEIFNQQERERVDPMQDGRKVTSIDQMDDGRWAFSVSGGGVKGEQPITEFRGTAEQGDNNVQTVTTDELINDHLGRRQAYEERYGVIGELLDDPAALLKHLENTRNVVNARITGMGGSPGVRDTSHQDKMELENLKHKNKKELEGVKHSNALEKAKQGAGSKVRPPDDVSKARWLMANVPGEDGQAMDAATAWQTVQDAKTNPNKFIESYVLQKLKSVGEYDEQPDPQALVEEARAVQSALSGEAMSGGDEAGSQEFQEGAIYQDEEGNRARYLGNGKWEDL